MIIAVVATLTFSSAAAACVTDSEGNVFCYETLEPMGDPLDEIEITEEDLIDLPGGTTDTGGTGGTGGAVFVLDLTYHTSNFDFNYFNSDVLVGVNSDGKVIMASTYCTDDSCTQEEVDNFLSGGVDSIDIDPEMKGIDLYENVVQGRVFKIILEGNNAIFQIKPSGTSTSENFKEFAFITGAMAPGDPINDIDINVEQIPGGEIAITPEAIDSIPAGKTDISIPEWTKKNAGWWADGLISDDDYVKGIEWMIKNGIIKI